MTMNLKVAMAILSAFTLLKGGQTSFARTTSEPIDPTEPTLRTVSAESEPEKAAVLSGSSDHQNPYAIITNRNVFQLTDPPPPPVNTPEIIVPTIKLTGLVKMAGQQTRALFVSVPKNPKDTTTYFNLAEGERQDALEVVKIMDNEESAEVINAGTKMTVSLKDSKDDKVAPGGPNQPSELAAQMMMRGRIPYPPNGHPPGQPAAEQQSTSESGSGVMVVGATPTPDEPAQSQIPQRMMLRNLRRIPPPPMPGK